MLPLPAPVIPPRRRLAPVLSVLAVLGISWLAACAWLLLGAAQDASDGRDLIEGAREHLSRRDILSGEVDVVLRVAQERFADAESNASSWLLAPLRHAPVVGRQLRSLEALSGAGAEILAVGADGVEEIAATVDGGFPAGSGRVEVLRRLSGSAGRTARRVAAVDLGPSDALFGNLADVRATLDRELSDVLGVLEQTEQAAAGLAAVLDGPKRFLLFAANNAEMQAGWGMPLSVGVLEVEDGRLALGEMRSTGDLRLDESVPLPPDLQETWGWLEPGREWRNIAVSPNLDVVGPVAREMWQAVGGEPVDGVVALDPLGLRAFLRATGPIEVGGRRLGPDDLVEYLLNGQYEGVEIDAEQDERRDVLSAVANAAVAALEGDVDLIELAEGLLDAVNGRHILAWSADPSDQRTWEAAGVDGVLTRDSLMVSLVNRGANKLDWYTDLGSRLELFRTDEGRMGVLTVTVDNRAPTEESYVAGPTPGTAATRAGDYVGVLTVHLPSGSELVSLDGAPPSVIGRDGRSVVVGAALLPLPAGERAEVQIRFLIRPDLDTIVVEPSARVWPIAWRAGGERWDDGGRRAVPVPASDN